ncbi:MAG TPA: CD225/dispanin family protein [Pyrinomonadaceae bacterium]|nr:CD225/dispanin family protein [Pyrinomonadaceae bacterium]
MSQSWTPPPAGGGSEPIPNYLVPAIIAIFCCWPLAIPAIIFATQVNSNVAAGNIAAAQEASAKAKKFMKLAFIVGVICWVLFILFYVFMFGIAILTSSH